MSTVEGRSRSRWGPKEDRAEFGGMSTELPAGLTESQLKSYVVYIRLEEINRKLKKGQVLPFRQRSRSPSGTSNEERQEHYKKKLEDERARLIESALQNNPEYSTDLDYNTWLDKHLFGPGAREKRSASHSANSSNQQGNNSAAGSLKCQEKVWIPQREYPDINFIGLLIGPRGNTLKKMESETGTKVSIRGKGSLKEGKNDAASLAAADEELHALVMADSVDKVEKCVRIINKIIETAASMPEEANELKRIQLRELALLNGTLRDEESIVCGNCGQAGHRRFECTERRNVTNSLICRICGGTGHIASDCMHRDNPEMLQQSLQRAEAMQYAYQDFLADISGGAYATGIKAPEVSAANPWASTGPNPASQPWSQAGSQTNTASSNPWSSSTKHQ